LPAYHAWPEAPPLMTLDQKKSLIRQFLERCNRYADDKLADYDERLRSASAADALSLQDKIGHWTADRAFNLYAIEELADGGLDGWFESFEIE
jgi:hypothetical protein